MPQIHTPTIDEIISTASAISFGKPLIENGQRGLIAEIMVAKALETVEPGWRHTAGDWGGWDFEHRDGTRLEVKQSTARQSWAPPANPKSAQFSIAAKAGYWRGSAWIGEPARLAQLYVFAYHPIVSDDADHRDARQWAFYVIPSLSLPVTAKSISLEPVKRLATLTGWSGLGAEIERLRLLPSGLPLRRSKTDVQPKAEFTHG
jgi:hypothetical protein